MSGFDRGKFSGAKVSTLKTVQSDAKKNDKSFSNGGGGRVDFFEVKEGKNVFRILPPHPEDKIGAPYLAKRVAMLKCEVPIFKDGEDSGKTEIKNKNIFIATQHGGLTKDPVELYIEYARNYANEAYQDKDDRQKFLAPITGYKDKKGKWNWGIIPKTSYVSYAINEGKVGRLELWDSWVKEMDKLAISEDADSVIDVDPFSDPDEGFPLIINKDKAVDKQGKETGKFEYTVTKDEPSRAKRESWDDFFKRVRVTDEQLEDLLKQEPLSKLYGSDIYSKKDWELAIDGLQRFDEENKYGIFENDDFIKELDELEKLVPVKVERDEDIKEAFKPKAEDKPKKEVDLPPSESTEEEMSIPEIKFALKKFIRKEFGDQYVNQIPADEKKLKLWFSMYSEGDDLPIKLDEVKPEAEIKTKDIDNSSQAEDAAKNWEKTKSEPVNDDVQSEIDKLRNRRKRNQE